MNYSEYQELRIRRVEPGILEIVMRAEEGKLSITNARMHGEMARIWLDVDRDAETRVAILRGEGRGFSAGGDLAMVEEMTRDFAVRARGELARDFQRLRLELSFLAGERDESEPLRLLAADGLA